MLRALGVPLADKLVARFGAKMGDVDESRRIVGLNPDNRTWRDRLQTLAQLEDRQRAQQPARVKIIVKFHAPQSGAGVTDCPRACDGRQGDATPRLG